MSYIEIGATRRGIGTCINTSLASTISRHAQKKLDNNGAPFTSLMVLDALESNGLKAACKKYLDICEATGKNLPFPSWVNTAAIATLGVIETLTGRSLWFDMWDII